MRQPLTYFGILLIIVGIGILLLTVFGIQALKAHDEWFVPWQFGPKRPPQVTYDQLYDFTIQLNELRGKAELRFFYTLTLSCLTLGAVFLAWACDRKRLLAVGASISKPPA